ncbi:MULTISPECIES: hypothetical protein [unclassified Novosphingobium]|uniref:hypothetical protein n=1 Tax=unclassified Novosphingobium TaxID=2644732 RepID=UPI00135B55FE|nr:MULTISPECIES: hypothetical protein [unclassified Novosphingobium]
MTDLFTNTPLPRAKAGEGSGKLIGHMVNGMSRAEMAQNYAAGAYPDVHPAYLAEAGIGSTGASA